MLLHIKTLADFHYEHIPLLFDKQLTSKTSFSSLEMQQKSKSVSFHSDVDSLNNHKSSPVFQKQLSIVEESENPESPTEKKSYKLTNDDDTRHSSAHSSAEHLPAITVPQSRQNRHYLSPEGDHHEKEPLNTSNSSRRPSIQLLQEFLSSRRSSTIMAALRRPSLALFRSKPEDPNDPANKPEAIEQRRKNRRIGK
jgi:hypothetical protein